MRGKWLDIWRARPRLGRREKIWVNLLASALAACLLWAAVGYPLPTAELELRRWERANLLQRSEIVFQAGANERLGGPEGQYDFAHTLLIALSEGRAVVGEGQRVGMAFRSFALGEGPLATSIPWTFRMPIVSGDTIRVCTPVLVFQVPGEAAGGEITLTAMRGTGPERREDEGIFCSGPGWPLCEGVWLFAAYPELESDWSLFSDAPYTLRLFQADGSPLLEQRGQLGKT